MEITDSHYHQPAEEAKIDFISMIHEHLINTLVKLSVYLHQSTWLPE